MADRQDIDALMVGALYGELDAAESARLESHLSSHPEDRSAMQGLERTRATLRRGMADLPAAEPPQAISAVLLQAAARRTPARSAAARDPEGDGLWARLVEWFRRGAMHPAVAAAAVLVLVAGTATALWVRGKGEVTEPSLPPSAEQAAAPTAPAPAQDPQAVAAGRGTASADLYDVDTTSVDEAVVREGQLSDTTTQKDRLEGRNAQGRGADKAVASAAPRAEDRRREVKQANSGFEVGGADRSPAVMDMPTADEELKLEVPSDQAGGKQDGLAGAAAGTGKAARPATEPRSDAPADEQWARTAHTRLVKLVSAGKCPEAGRLGAEIKDRAPEYYAASVANDRGIRQCKQYIETRAKKKAEKAYKSRSQQNTYDDAAESPAAN